MFETFLRIDGNMFKLGLSAEELIILAKIMEFHYNTGKVFVSNEMFAELCGCSESTIKRKIKHLEELGLIVKETKAKQQGKERKIFFQEEKYLELTGAAKGEKVDETSAKVKMTLAESSKCTLRKEQNEPIKDNIEKKKEKEKETEKIHLSAPLQDELSQCKNRGGSKVIPLPEAKSKVSTKPSVEDVWKSCDNNGTFNF